MGKGREHRWIRWEGTRGREYTEEGIYVEAWGAYILQYIGDAGEKAQRNRGNE